MNGKQTDNSSFLHGATRGKPGKKLTAWQKKPHLHRALIRGAISYPLWLTLILAIIAPRLALIVLGVTLILWSIPGFRMIRRVFFMPYIMTDAVSGHKTQIWRLRNKWRRLFHMQPIPGQLTRKQKRENPELPPELERVIREAINAEMGATVPPATHVEPIPPPYRRRR